jgi:hypothetical protein
LKFKKREYLWLSLILLIFALRCLDGNISTYGDNIFLYNRAYQMYNCLKDGILPYFYYNDAQGLGYGSSFFYGQLNLIPFLWCVPLGIDAFVKLFYLSEVLLNYFGIKLFSARFVKNNDVVAVIFCMSPLFVSYQLLANLFGVGLSWFFLAYCVDFFRDSKPFYKASLFFVLILNSHIISAFMSFVFCVAIFIKYFKVDRIKDYVKFAVTTILICSYSICNILYHADSLTSVSNVYLIESTVTSLGSSQVNSILFIGGYTFRLLLSKIFGVAPLVGGSLLCISLLLYLLYIKFKNKIHNIIYPLSLVAVIIGIKPIWLAINSKVNIFFQFPVRYEFYLLVFCLIPIIDYTNVKIIKVLMVICTLDIIFTGAFTINSEPITDEPLTDFDYQIGCGEYLGKTFTHEKSYYDYVISGVHTQDGSLINYEVDKNKLILHIPDHSDDYTLTLPKLYYKGYITSDSSIKCYSGYSNYLTIDIGTYSGDLVVYYNQPIFLRILQLFCIFVALYLIRRIIKWRYVS